MYFSAAASSSAVLTPSRILAASSFIVRAWMAPAAAIFSISAGDFLMITAVGPRRGGYLDLDVVFEPQRRNGGSDVVVHLGRRMRPVEPPEQPLLVVVVD